MKPLLIPILCTFLFASCKKNDAKSYTAHMGGMRNWHLNDTDHIHRYISPDSSYYYTQITDTNVSFALTVVSGEKISNGSYMYTYSKTDATGPSYIFTGLTSPSSIITYYYLEDSIVIFSYHEGVSEDFTRYYRTY